MKTHRFLFIALAVLALLTFATLRAAAKPLSAIYVTNNLDETSDGNGCSLREAITNANNDAQTFSDCPAGVGADNIYFNIGSGGPQTINVGIEGAGLPTITDPVTMDGTTQPGCAKYPCIELNGAGVKPTGDGLKISAGNSVVRGLVINQFHDFGIELTTNGGNVLMGNYVGTDMTGSVMRGNYEGFRIQDGADGNRIGGTTAEERNLISGNKTDGIVIKANGNRIQGNYIGTDLNGVNALGNGLRGIWINGSSNIVGGTVKSRNVISGNLAGIGLYQGKGNLVQNNYIGTDATGSDALGNESYGVIIYGNTISNRIRKNIIAFNSDRGVIVGLNTKDRSTSNLINENSIYANGSLGIDLADDGVTSNDIGDGDKGPNTLQNSPGLFVTGSTTIGLDMVSKPYTSYRIEFFVSESCDPSGNGEGQMYLGATTVTTDSTGFGGTQFVPSPLTFVLGKSFTATATGPYNNTSEFSNCVNVP